MSSTRQCMFLGGAAVLMAALLALPGCGGSRAVPGPGAGAGIESSSRAPGVIPGEYIVVLNDGAAPADVIRAHGIAARFVYKAALNGFAGPLPPGQLKKLQGDPGVKYIEPDQIVSLIEPVEAQAPGKGKPAGGGTAQPPQQVPTGVRRIGADENANAGLGVGVAIIDTGIDLTHPDLAANIAGGFNAINTRRSAKDDNGHGTHVAGTVAALDNTIGVVGVAPLAKLYAVKVLGANGSGSYSAVIAGVDWVTAHAGQVKVANMSLGGPPSQALDDAVTASVGAGVTYVVAAGNEGQDAGSYSPARCPAAIAVSAIVDTDGSPGGGGPSTVDGADDTFAAFSNYGSDVDIAAPGVQILSTYKGAAYATGSGTSMASPHVAGAAALYLASNPSATPGDVALALTQTYGAAQTGPLGFGGDPDTSAEPLVYALDL